MSRVRRWIRRAKRRIEVVAEILRHPKTPWYVRLVGFLVIAYAASPLDLIPDFIPVLGYLDDVVLVPLGIVLVVRLTPREIRFDAIRTVVRGRSQGRSRLGRWGSVVIVLVWVVLLYFLVRFVLRLVR